MLDLVGESVQYIAMEGYPVPCGGIMVCGNWVVGRVLSFLCVIQIGL